MNAPPFHIRTIPPTFRRARVCVCLYGFAFALSHPLFAMLTSVCTYTVLHLNYHISLFVGRASVCAWLALRPCKALGHTRLRHPCLACPSRSTEPLHPHSHLKRTFIPRLTPPPLPFYERSADFPSALSLENRHHPCLLMNALLALRPCKAFGRSTSGIHARPRKRVRFCCSVKPSQLWWGLLPIRTINEIFRTIPPTFRRGVGLCQE